jgi:hypothetical protein
MASIRPVLFSLLALPLVACTSDEQEPPSGPHYGYVANTVSVPTSNQQATEFGLDLDGDKQVDNQLGQVLAALKGQGFDVQGTIDEAVAQGDIILLVDFQTKSFTSTAGAGLAIKLGDKATAMPKPCVDMNDMTCGKHLAGTGTFTVAANSPDNVAVAGKIAGGTFNGGPGDLTLQIALGGTMAVSLDLIEARAKASGISDTGMTTLILAGALTESDLNMKVIPAIHGQIGPLVARDCNAPTMPPDCGCMNPSTGKTVLGLFDAPPKDCMVTVDEIKNHSLIKSLLAPDLVDGKFKTNPSLSLGVKATAVKGAGFTQ